jgi:hypothetical protein
MAFFNIENSTSTSPYDMNDNFLHVANTSITPKGGTELLETTSIYNIGSSSYIWNRGYFSGTISAEIATNARSFFKVASIELTLPAIKIEITGLNGDAQKKLFYRIMFCHRIKYN